MDPNWIYDGQTVANVASVTFGIVSLLFSIPSLFIARQSKKAAVIVQRREIGRDANPLYDALGIKLSHLGSAVRSGDTNLMSTLRNEAREIIASLQSVLVDYPRVIAYLTDMDTYVDLAVSQVIDLRRKVPLLKSLEGEIADDASNRVISLVAYQTKSLKVDVHQKGWVKAAHSELKARGAEQVEATRELYGADNRGR